MDAPAPAHELIAALTRAAAALDAGDSDSAAAEMASAAGLCQHLQTAGIAVPPTELDRMRVLHERCGVALDRMEQELNAAGFRDDQQRRGMEAYQGHSARGR